MTKTANWFRLALSCLLLGSIVWFWHSRFDEVLYHSFAPEELVDIGDATAFSHEQKAVPFNSYVSVSGILGNKAATISGLRAGSLRFGRYQVRHLLGSKLYVEYDEAKYHKSFTPFTRVQVKGRLVSFGAASSLEKVREFFKNYYQQPVDDNAMLIVLDERPRSEIKYILLFTLSMLLLAISFFISLRPFFRTEKS